MRPLLVMLRGYELGPTGMDSYSRQRFADANAQNTVKGLGQSLLYQFGSPNDIPLDQGAQCTANSLRIFNDNS